MSHAYARTALPGRRPTSFSRPTQQRRDRPAHRSTRFYFPSVFISGIHLFGAAVRAASIYAPRQARSDRCELDGQQIQSAMPGRLLRKPTTSSRFLLLHHFYLLYSLADPVQPRAELITGLFLMTGFLNAGRRCWFPMGLSVRADADVRLAGTATLHRRMDPWRPATWLSGATPMLGGEGAFLVRPNALAGARKPALA